MKLRPFYLTIAALLLARCSDDDQAPVNPVDAENQPITVTILRDLGNASSSSDLAFVFRADETISGDIRAFFVKSGSELTVETASGLSESQYLAITASDSDDFLRFEGGMQDADGEPIENNTFYALQLLALDQDYISPPSKVFSLKDVGILNGEYTGSWNDNLYSDFAVSFTLEGSDGDFEGDFFYTGGFRSCCNGAGATDGTVEVTSSFDQITRFTYRQLLSQFVGVNGTNYQNCSGTYNGSGTFDFRKNTMSLTFSGSDCEGGHTGGTLVMVRQEN